MAPWNGPNKFWIWPRLRVLLHCVRRSTARHGTDLVRKRQRVHGAVPYRIVPDPVLKNLLVAMFEVDAATLRRAAASITELNIHMPLISVYSVSDESLSSGGKGSPLPHSHVMKLARYLPCDRRQHTKQMDLTAIRRAYRLM